MNEKRTIWHGYPSTLHIDIERMVREHGCVPTWVIDESDTVRYLQIFYFPDDGSFRTCRVTAEALAYLNDLPFVLKRTTEKMKRAPLPS